jgi:two-component system CheB/CheR fusion protein
MSPVRIWTLGCSTGQEAYSLVMAFTEVAEAMGKPVTLQLFATDLNPVGIERRARALLEGHRPGRLARAPARFFVEVDGQYRISKTMRDACVFSATTCSPIRPFPTSI